MAKILIVEFSDNENDIAEEMFQWLSDKLSSEPLTVKEVNTSLKINPFKRTVKNFKDEDLNLTAKEFDLLYFLSSHKGQVFTKEQIYEKVWGYDNAPDARNLSSFIRKLRLKIEPHPDNPRYIITVWGVGYKFSGEEKP